MTRSVQVIRPPSFSMWAMGQHLARLVECRDLVYTLTLHRISVRYKQSVLGYFWAVLHPVLLLLLYTMIFSRLAAVPTHGAPYAVFAFTALLPWTFFSNGLSGATIGLPAHSNLMSKVYFPREILPLSYVLASFLDFLIASVVLAALMFYYGFRLTASALWIIPAMLTLTVFLTGIALIASVLQARFRDVGVAMPLLLQVWMFATPVVYSRASVPQGWRHWYDLNPLVAIMETFRGALLHSALPDRMLLAECLAVSLLVAAVSYAWFKHVEATLMDVI
ncbi:MAG: ABC transporter permease [Acidobacteriia bacterium]|nr:ABC transporter permease [Terriglobia bacterium]